MAISNHIRDRQKQSHKENPIDGGDDRRVCDIQAHSKLDAIADALGASLPSTAPTIFNKAIPVAGAEVSQALPAGTTEFRVRSRSKGTIQLAYAVGDTGTNYITIKPGNVFVDTNSYTSQTIYFRSTKAGDVLEIIAFT